MAGARFQIDLAVKGADSVTSAATSTGVLANKLGVVGAAAATAETKVAKAMSGVSKTASSAGSGKINEMAEGFGKLGGPLGAIGQKAFGSAEGVKKLLGSLGSGGGAVAAFGVGSVALAAAIIAVGVAAASAVIAVGSWAVGLADAARTQGLLAAGVARSVKGGEVLEAQIDDLSTKVPLANEELLSMAGELANSGLRGKELAGALQTAAVKAATLKFGPDFQKQLLSISSQTARLKTNISHVFGGLKIEGLLEGLAKLVELFDSSSVTGKAMKVVFESVFQPLIDGLTALIPKAVTTFIQLEILALKAAIAIKPYGSKIAFVAEALGVLAAVVVGVVVVAIAAVLASVALLGVAIVVLGEVFSAVGNAAFSFGSAIINGASSAFDWLHNKATEAVNFLQSLSLSDIGKAMIDGLVAGITGAGGAVLSSLTGVVSGAVDGAKKFLGIASPSKLLHDQIGENMGEGVAGGIDTSAGSVKSSLESVVTPPAQLGGGLGAGKGDGGGKSIDLSNAQFIFQGVEGAEDAEARFGELLTRIVEGDLTQLGGMEPSA